MAVAAILTPSEVGSLPQSCCIQNYWTKMTPEGDAWE